MRRHKRLRDILKEYHEARRSAISDRRQRCKADKYKAEIAVIVEQLKIYLGRHYEKVKKKCKALMEAEKIAEEYKKKHRRRIRPIESK